MRRTGSRILTFDVGGSHASVALACGSPFSLSGAGSAPINSSGSAEEILGALEKLGKGVLKKASLDDISGVSLGMPNPFDYENGISYMKHKYEGLYGRDLKSEMASRFGVAPSCVTFVNDACAYLLGEVYCGAATEASRVVGITLGTGVGSAFAVEKRIVTTGDGVPNGGFLWNIPCGGGILEDLISTRAVQGLYKARTGKLMEVREIALLAASDEDAVSAMREFGSTLGRMLKQVCLDFRPEMVVLGGAISRSAHLFLPAAEEQLVGTGIRVVVSQLFDDAALLGAAVGWQLAQEAVAAGGSH